MGWGASFVEAGKWMKRDESRPCVFVCVRGKGLSCRSRDHIVYADERHRLIYLIQSAMAQRGLDKKLSASASLILLF